MSSFPFRWIPDINICLILATQPRASVVSVDQTSEVQRSRADSQTCLLKREREGSRWVQLPDPLTSGWLKLERCASVRRWRLLIRRPAKSLRRRWGEGVGVNSTEEGAEVCHPSSRNRK